MGRAPDTQRTADARDRSRRINRSEVPDQAAGARSQGWKIFLRDHAAGIASIDLFVVRTLTFKLLYGLVIRRHARRGLVSISVTNNPTAEWLAGQVTDAFPWDEAPRHLIHDRDNAFGPAFTGRIRAMGIRDHLRRHAHCGRTGTLSASSDRSAVNASIMSSCSMKRTCVVC